MFNKKQKHISPMGIAVFPKLTKPDTKFNKDGVYETKLKFADKADEEKFMAYLQPLLDEAHIEICKEQKKKTIKKVLPWTAEVEKIKDEEGNVVEENPTGAMLFKFKLNATMKLKDGTVLHPKPHLFDAKGTAIKADSNFFVSGGSIIRVSFTCRPYYTAKDNVAGLTMNIFGVQIVKLVEAGGASAESCGFGSVDGYSHEGGTASEPSGDMPSQPGDEAPDPTDSDASDF